MVSLLDRRTKLVHELAIVFILAISIRSIPAIFNWGWGNDFGIYYGLTKELVKDPQLFQSYTGWGKSYNYFPMLYLIIAFLHIITGIEIPALLRSVSPVLGSLSVVFFYLFVREILRQEGDRKQENLRLLYSYLPFVSAALLAMNPFHAYQTAHAAPLTVGHMMMMLSLWLFATKNRHSWVSHFLYPASLMLLMSHHLTTFVYIIFIIGIIFFRARSKPDEYEDFLSDFAYLIVFTTLSFGYWALIATPVFYRFIPNAANMPAPYVVLLFYTAVALMFIHFRLRWKKGKYHKPMAVDRNTEKRLAIGITAGILAIIIGFTFTDFGTGFRFLPLAPVLLAPTIILLGFAVVGMNRVGGYEFSYYLRGLFFPIVAVFIYSIVTWNRIIFPFRMVEYIVYPLVIYEGVGIITLIHEILHIKTEKTDEKEFYRRASSLLDAIKIFKINRDKKTIAFSLFVASLILISGATTYAVQRVTSGYEEAISTEVADAIEYLKENVTPNTTIASDHRISTLLWEAGFTPTYDSAYYLWFSDRWNDSGCLMELRGYGVDGSYYGPVEYIVIDSVMVRDGVQSNINETPRPLIPEYYEKFNNEPFELIYEDVSDAQLMDDEEWEMANETGEYLDKYPYIGAMSKNLPNAVNWCRIYRVNWTYIDEVMNITANQSSNTTRSIDIYHSLGGWSLNSIFNGYMAVDSVCGKPLYSRRIS